MTDKIFTINNLNLKFNETVLFDNASFEILKGKVNVIIGPNGVGKTTLLKIIANGGKEYEIENNATRTFHLPQKIQYPTGITLFEYLSSIYFKDNFKWFLEKSEKVEIIEVLKEFEILNKKDLYIEKLSSGELQKANIALALISKADFLLLDEPTSNMDLINQIKTLSMIKKLGQKGLTSVVILHDVNLSSSYGDYFIGLGPNNCIVKGNKEEFFTNKNLNDIYNIEFKVINNDENFHVQIFN